MCSLQVQAMDDTPPDEPQPEPEVSKMETRSSAEPTDMHDGPDGTGHVSGEAEAREPLKAGQKVRGPHPIDGKGILELGLPMAVADELLNIIQVSRKLMELSSYSEEELMGVPVAMLLDEASRENMFERVQELTGQDGEAHAALSMPIKLQDQAGGTQEAELSLLPLVGEGWVRYLMLFDLAIPTATGEMVRPMLDMGPLPVPMVLVNAQGQMSYLNPVAAEVLGFSEATEALGQSFSTMLVDEGDLRPFQRLLEARGEVMAYQLRLRTHQGNHFVTEVTAGALKDEAGQPAGFLALIKDITSDVLQATESLSLSHHYQELVAGAPVGLALLDPDHRFRSANLALRRLMGCSEEDLIGKRVEELVQPAQTERLEAELDRLLILQDAPAVTLEVEGRRIDGSTLPLTLQMATVPQAHGAVAIFQDATSQRAAIEQVKALEERYRELFENYDQTMVLADDDGYVMDANKVACEIFDLTKEEVIGRHIDEVLGDFGGSQERKALSPDDPETLRSGAPTPMSDISRQELERLIREEKMAALGHLVAGVAHHINNPLAFVRAYTNSLPEHLDSLEELLKAYESLAQVSQDTKKASVVKALGAVSKAKEEAQLEAVFTHLRKQVKSSLEGLDRIASVTEKLRAYARPDTGPPQAADVCEGLQMALDLTLPHFAKEVTIDEKLEVVPATLCQPTLLNQVFQALLVNAAQAVGDKGKVTVVCRATDKEIEVEVTDTGPGMPERLLRNIFNPLFTTRHEGVGLGLTIAYWIVQLHDGSIEVDSQVGKGTTFIVRLPIRTPDGRSNSGQPTAGSQPTVSG